MAIHASINQKYVREVLDAHPTLARDYDLDELWPTGVILGTARLVDCVELHPDLESNPWATGPYCWEFTDARLLPRPIPFKGKLNLFHLDAATANEVARQSSASTSAPLSDKDIARIVEAIQLPKLLQCHYQVLSYFLMDYLEDAERLCSESMALDSTEAVHFRAQRATVRLEMGDFDKATEDIRAVLLAQPDFGSMYSLLAIIHLKRGEHDQAHDDFDKASELGWETQTWDEFVASVTAGESE